MTGKQQGLLILITFVTLLLNACGTKTVLMTVTRPAEINLKNYQKIALGDFVNARGQTDQHALDLRDAFTNQLINTKRFEVVDRQALGRILEEQKLAISGLIDESSAPQIGKLLGASALIFGRITQDQFKEEVKQTGTYKDKKGKQHKRFKRYASYTLGVNLKIVDVQSGKILISKELKSIQKAEATAVDKRPARIDKQNLYQKCLADISTQFRHMIAPYKVTVKAQFLVDDKVPATKRAVAFFKADEWEKGLQVLKKALNRPIHDKKLKAKVYYDLGLAQMYLGRHEEAIQNLTRALELKPNESRYQKALKTAKEEKKKAEKLKGQL